MIFRACMLFLFFNLLFVSGCGNKVIDDEPKYIGYDCQQIFRAMEYKVAEANLLYTNYEDEDSISKFGTGALGTAAGAAMASSLILTPLGWAVAGGLMLAGTGSMIDGLSHDELSDSEQVKLQQYTREYNELKMVALEKECDYYAIPKWDIGPKNKE